MGWEAEGALLRLCSECVGSIGRYVRVVGEERASSSSSRVEALLRRESLDGAREEMVAS